jgi:tRNA (guanine37-N1)-methyltransferase
MEHAPGTKRIDVVTLFPAMVADAAKVGVTGRAAERALWSLRAGTRATSRPTRTARWTTGRTAAGPGMVMMAAPLAAAIAAARQAQAADGVTRTHVVHLTPAGRPLKHADVVAMAARRDEGLVLLAGRYEGIDERLGRARGGRGDRDRRFRRQRRRAAGADADRRDRAAVARSAERRAIGGRGIVRGGLLDCPHYTRPEAYGDAKVPDVLVSGHHEAIRRWRLEQSLRRTWKRRPDLLDGRALTKEERELLAKVRDEDRGRA